MTLRHDDILVSSRRQEGENEPPPLVLIGPAGERFYGDSMRITFLGSETIQDDIWLVLLLQIQHSTKITSIGVE